MRNALPYVAAAIRSVLAERQMPLELIVVDDGSNDGSKQIVSKLDDRRLRIVDGPRQGIAAAFNAGLSNSQGKIIMRCDADDLYPPGRIERQVKWLTKNSEFGAVSAAFKAFDADGKVGVPLGTSASEKEITDEIRNGVVRTHYCTFAIRAEVLRSIGGARPFFRTAEDIDLQLRVGEVCRIWHLVDTAYLYRVHNESITHGVSCGSREFYEDQARRFQRQRLHGGGDDLQRGKWPPLPDWSQGAVQSAADHMQGLLIGQMWIELAAGRPTTALKLALQIVRQNPSSWITWRQLLVLTLKVFAQALGFSRDNNNK
jgi:glycosyltransferase involved in cell wall biosynthesis